MSFGYHVSVIIYIQSHLNSDHESNGCNGCNTGTSLSGLPNMFTLGP